jgi:hypothetical protein
VCVYDNGAAPGNGFFGSCWACAVSYKHAYLVSIFVKELVLKVNGKEQNVDVSVMVFLYKFFWYGFLVYRIEKR